LPATIGTTAPVANVISTSPTRLERECVTLTAHLIGHPPTRPVIDAFLRAHDTSTQFRAETAFDAWLVAIARLHVFTARLADSYAGVVAPKGLLRRKLVLLLAILETSSPHYQTIDAPLAPGAARTALALVGRGTLAVAVTFLAACALWPVHLASMVVGRRR